MPPSKSAEGARIPPTSVGKRRVLSATRSAVGFARLMPKLFSWGKCCPSVTKRGLKSKMMSLCIEEPHQEFGQGGAQSEATVRALGDEASERVHTCLADDGEDKVNDGQD